MTAKEIVHAMYEQDAFSQWLGITFDEISKEKVVLSMTVRPEMVNGFGIAHGGISFSLADSAFAFASNANGKHAVSIDVNISHLKPIAVGDVLTASTTAIKVGRTTATYLVHIFNQNQEQVALFKGTVFRMDKKWEK